MELLIGPLAIMLAVIYWVIDSELMACRLREARRYKDTNIHALTCLRCNQSGIDVSDPQFDCPSCDGAGIKIIKNDKSMEVMQCYSDIYKFRSRHCWTKAI